MGGYNCAQAVNHEIHEKKSCNTALRNYTCTMIVVASSTAFRWSYPKQELTGQYHIKFCSMFHYSLAVM